MIALLTLFSCAKQPDVVAPELDVERHEEIAPSVTYNRADTIPDDDVPGDVADFRRDVRALHGELWDPDHEQIVDALESLADAMDEIPNRPEATERDADRVRELADMVDDSDVTSINRTRWVREALLIAAQGIEEIDVARVEGLTNAIKGLREGAMGLDPSMPLLKQRVQLMGAFDSAADALVLASYERPYGAGTR
ncbi:MAG: hypothetical protein ACOZNI_35965 [Myxococcota bacterium]